MNIVFLSFELVLMSCRDFLWKITVNLQKSPGLRNTIINNFWYVQHPDCLIVYISGKFDLAEKKEISWVNSLISEPIRSQDVAHIKKYKNVSMNFWEDL